MCDTSKILVREQHCFDTAKLTSVSGCFLSQLYLKITFMKKNSSLLLAALMLAIGSTSLPLTISSAQAQTAAAEPAKSETVRAEMGKPLAEIQDLLNKKQYAEALQKINALDAMENKTPYEQFAMHRLRAVVASGLNDTPLLASSFEGMLNSPFLKLPEQLRLIEAMAGTYFNEKKYSLSKQWAQRYLDKDSNNESMHNLIIRAMYLQDDFTGAAKELNLVLKADDEAKRVPSNDNLRLLGSCYQQLKDNAGYTAVLERLVTHYPKKEYWADLLYRIEHKPGFAERLRLDLYRLLLATENLEEGAQYYEMAQLAQLAGLPAEAKKVVDAGFANNMLGTGKEAAKQKQLRDQVNKQAAEDAKSLDAGEAAAKASKNGTGMVSMGYNYAIQGQADKGIALIEQGIAKGGLKAPEEAKLHLGMAYLQANNKVKAAEIFKTIQGNDGTSDLGRLWLLVR